MSEWQQDAPLLHRFLIAVASSTGTPTTDQIPPICMAGCVLLRARNIHISAFQHIVGLLLFYGNSTKQVAMLLIEICVLLCVHDLHQQNVKYPGH